MTPPSTTPPSTTSPLTTSPTSHILPLGMSFPCPQCPQRCKNLSGLKRHQHSAHQHHPGLSIPVAELRRVYHPSLSGTYIILPMLRYPNASQACGVINMESLSHRMFHQKHQPPKPMTIGPPSRPEPGLNSRSSCLRTLNFREERLTTFLNCGLPRSFPMATPRPSPTTGIFIAKSTQSRWATFSGSAFP